MYRLRGLILVLFAAVLALPSLSQAQQSPKDDKYTKEANKHIGLAMVKQAPEEKLVAYQAAIDALQEGLVAAADNPKIWYIAGQAYAGTKQFDKAIEAFDKAVALWPEYKEEVDTEREIAWLGAFEAGVAQMDAQNYEEALRILEAGQRLYDKRPEALLNMGSMYAGTDQLDKAEEAFTKAIESINGPLFADLDEEGKAQWKQYERMSLANIAQIRGQKGVIAFEADNFDEAAEMFAKAAEANPHSRDYLHNVAQAYFAKSENLREARDTAIAPGQAPQDAELIRIYRALPAQIEKVMPLDPNNSAMLLILAVSQRRLGELTGDTTTGQQSALVTLQKRAAMTVWLQDIAIVPGQGDAKVQGVMMNNTLEPGQSARIRFTLLGAEGAEIASQEVTVAAAQMEATCAGATEPCSATTNFEATIPGVTESVAGWKYAVVN
jgi:tetratricopeptide (TPR) repeat protein